MLQNLISAPNLLTYYTDRRYSLEQLQTKPELKKLDFVQMEQTHGNQTLVIDNLDMIKSWPKQNYCYFAPQVDALLTQEQNLALVVRTADCLPVLLYHPLWLIGVVHAGRKGTKKKILQKTLQLLKDKFGIKDQLTLWFGPRICKKCHEIDSVKKLHFDLLAENIQQTRQVFKTNQAKIIDSGHCTSCEHKRFYSYRLGDELRNYGVIVQKAGLLPTPLTKLH
ncbi:MAG: hypothetical protein GF390_02460 [Candidatus Pacebacteria bacterium]|nr:hypothetical protein [Candidatus Paceibacterota bacterium]